ncbi:hypothetical protein RHMOL_Rhmol04G0180400 [Rhododendron molle]|uniref:Uncharacterized protein n=1 Tax=Rhododendron molle TaxID=49168 RepID=A0ACC0P455_RHOML|nr:hypothetical protein RHMOL_Rhmol04G0180400 [Rhododendron molle]
MNMFGLEPALYNFRFSVLSIIGSLSHSPFQILYNFTKTNYDDDRPPPAVVMPKKKKANPLRHRHDGTSPLPFAMDWSPPPGGRR